MSFASFFNYSWLVADISSAQDTTSSNVLFTLFSFLAWHAISIFCSKLWTVGPLFGDTQSVPLRTACPYQYMPFHLFHRGVDTCMLSHVFNYQGAINLLHYMDGIFNGARESFCETGLHRYTQFHNGEVTILNHEEFLWSRTNVLLLNLQDRIGTSVK